MPLKSVCPSCQTEYQLSPTMLGRQMRCPQSKCRAVFTVTESPAPPDVAASGEVARPSEAEEKTATESRATEAGKPGPVTVDELGLLLPSETALPDTEMELVTEDGNEVPVLPAEEAAPAAEAPREASWQEPPAGPTEPAPRRGSAAKGQRQVREYDAGDWQTHAPPPRRGRAAGEAAEEPVLDSGEPIESPAAVLTAEGPDEGMAAGLAEEESVEEYTPPRTARWSRRIMGMLALLTLAVLVGGGLWVWHTVRNQEEKLAAEAYEAYEGGQYPTADQKFGGLLTTFTTSERKEEYELMQELSKLRAAVQEGRAKNEDLKGLLDQVARFTEDHATHPHVGARAPDVGQALGKVIKDFAEQNKTVTGTEPRAVIARAGEVIDQVARLSKDALPKKEEARLRGLLARVGSAVDSWERYEGAVKEILELAQRGAEHDVIPRMEKLRDEYAADFPEIRSESRIEERLKELEASHLSGIQYVRTGFDAQPPRPGAAGASILFDPLTQGNPLRSPEDEEVKLALARGVLYGLHKGDGSVRWAMRVGIDTTALPVRVPKTLVTPERILVISGSEDDYTLTALDGGGTALWEYRLTGASLGRPVIVGNRALVATWDGQIHEIELAEGRLVGRWIVGQRFTVGGTLDPHTNLAYFPAEHSFVYVLDVEGKQANILHSGHPSGSLRGEAVVIPEQEVFLAGRPDPVRRPGYLVLPQAPDQYEVRLRVFELPIRDRHAKALDLKPVPRVPGWTWFKPFQDGERLGMLSDEGVLGLFGIRQPGNQGDEHLFPLLDPGGVNLREFLGGGRRAGSREALGRAQVVQALDNDFWVLASGRLQRLQLGWHGAAGRQVVAGWQQPVEVGSPLHAGQVEEDPQTGRSTLYVVTRSLTTHACQATAVEDETGKVLWQRQLGMVCEGDPVVIRPGPDGPPVVVMQDQGGSLFALDPAPFPKLESGWIPAGQQMRLAGALPVAEDHPPLLFAGPGGESAYQLVFTENERKELEVVLRHAFFGEGSKVQVIDRKAALKSPLAGRPAVMGRWLVLPLADGILRRMALPEPGAVEVPRLEHSGSHWRGRLSPPGMPGHALALGGDLLLTTNGREGLTVWRWSPENDKVPDRLPDGEEVAHSLQGRVASAPVLVGAGEDWVRVCVADTNGDLVLLRILTQDPAAGAVTEERRWPVNGPVSDGPFVRTGPGGTRIGCVVDGSRLVWIDPEKEAPLWTHPVENSSVVGRPDLSDGLVVVAEESGRLVGLNPEDGKPVGAGYLLPGTVVPAANPVSFGAGRLLVPLSDGTARLLPVAGLKKGPAK